MKSITANSSVVRAAVTGFMLGLVAVVVPSCTKPCNADTCKTGCCGADGKCVETPTNNQCGTAGAACSACGEGTTCSSGTCEPVAPVMDAGVNTTCTDDANCTDTHYCNKATGICEAKCRIDADCRGGGKVCDDASKRCVVGTGCSIDVQCQITDDNQLFDGGLAENDPCFRSGIGCRCDLNDAPPNGQGLTGTCRRRLAPCEECTEDQECGVGLVFEPPEGRGEGKCAALAADTSGKKYCRYKRVGQCSCGTVDDGTGYCKPQSNSCQSVGCNVDKDCSAGNVCSVNQPDAGAGTCGGVCKPRCRWNFAADKRELVSPGCPSGETCWVDSNNLDPTSANYGSGRCRPPCSDDSQCRASADNPFGGTNLRCEGELLLGGGRDLKRCRADGECMDNVECPELPNNQPYVGYCDRGALSCKADCRVGSDPVTSRPYNDCRSPYSCAADGGSRVCRLLSCGEQGGASVACFRGELCANEDRNGDGTPELRNVPAALQAQDGCFEAPRIPGPFCKTCMSDGDCTNLQVESWMTCSNGAKNPSCSLLPSRCMQVGGSMMPKSACAIPTLNDFGANGGAQRGCPAQYSIVPIAHNETDGVADLCATDADCNIGTDAGRCAPEPQLRKADGGLRLACRCSAGTGKLQCPNGGDGGITSECLDGVPGSPQYCINTVVCLPGAWAYNPVGMPNKGAAYGCGL